MDGRNDASVTWGILSPQYSMVSAERKGSHMTHNAHTIIGTLRISVVVMIPRYGEEKVSRGKMVSVHSIQCAEDEISDEIQKFKSANPMFDTAPMRAQWTVSKDFIYESGKEF